MCPDVVTPKPCLTDKSCPGEARSTRFDIPCLGRECTRVRRLKPPAPEASRPAKTGLRGASGPQEMMRVSQQARRMTLESEKLLLGQAVGRATRAAASAPRIEIWSTHACGPRPGSPGPLLGLLTCQPWPAAEENDTRYASVPRPWPGRSTSCKCRARLSTATVSVPMYLLFEVP